MPAIDFKEIPIPTAGAGRDQFELFAREFLEFLGFKILVGPDRGPDSGRDLIVEEIRTGVSGETRIRWMASCKHKAHSGASVKPEDESDIHDRVRTHGCSGFIGFYSTVPSSGLASKLNASGLPFEVQVYDPERIENKILSSTDGRLLAKRFFPASYAKWEKDNPIPAKIFREDPSLYCAYCNKNLLIKKPHGIVVAWKTFDSDDYSKKTNIEHLYWCCNGRCDDVLKHRHYREGIIDSWEDISDLAIPIAYIRCVIATINEINDGTTYSEAAFKNMKHLLLNLFPLVSREMADSEIERIESLGFLPHYLGGWGY